MPRKSGDVPRFKVRGGRSGLVRDTAGSPADAARVCSGAQGRDPDSVRRIEERIAKETGVGYQTVLKRAIREGLKKAG